MTRADDQGEGDADQQQGPASASELGRPLDMSLAAVLQHVQMLQSSGLIRSQKVGRTRTCSINPVALRSAEDWIADRRTMVERRLDRLGEYLAQTAGNPDPDRALSPARQPTNRRSRNDRTSRHPQHVLG